MARDRIRSRASFKSKVWMGTGDPWPNSHDADFQGSDLVSGEGSGLVMIAGDAILSGFPGLSSKAAESPAGSRLPSSDLMTCSGSKAGAVVGEGVLD